MRPRVTIALLLLATAGMAGLAAGCGADEAGDDPGAGGGMSEVSMSDGDGAGGAGSEGSMGAEHDAAQADLLNGSLPLLNGEPQNLADYRGDVVMVVNTASECGFTPQFEQLEDLYQEKRSEGFVILGFPADDVAGQEPRSDEEIAEFCEANFGVSFPMFAKTNVIGDEANPLFKALAAVVGEPSWNFNKYLLDRDGNVVVRYDASDAPDDPALLAQLDKLLAEKS